MNEERGFGVEFEHFYPTLEAKDASLREIAHAVNLQGTGAEWFSSNDRQNTETWFAKSDSSIRPDEGCRGACELVTPVLRGQHGLAEVKTVLDIINSHGGKINNSCGLHVHHDAPDVNDKAIVNLYAFYRNNTPHLNQYFPRNRRTTSGNSYAGALGQTNFGTYAEIAASIKSLGRRCVNFSSMNARGSIEFRQHEGTVDPDDTKHWLLTTQAMIEWARSFEGSPLDYEKPPKVTGPLEDIGWVKPSLPLPEDLSQIHMLNRLGQFARRTATPFVGVPEAVMERLTLTEYPDITDRTLPDGRSIISQNEEEEFFIVGDIEDSETWEVLTEDMIDTLVRNGGQ